MMKKYMLTVIYMMIPLMNIQAAEFESYTMPRTQVVPITNSVNGGQYELLVKLPEEYGQDPKRRYPVIYFTDAVWQLDLLSAATTFLMDEVILVGISWQKDMPKINGEAAAPHASRFRDYTVTPSSDQARQAKYHFGQATEHLTFIRKDVFKRVDALYNTKPNQRAYFGYSLGGQFGMYALIAQPDTFNHYILGSPALGGSVDYLSELLSKQKQLHANVFISYGDQEPRLKKHVDKLISKLNDHKQGQLSLTHEVMDGDHSQAVPMTVARGVTWLSNL
ncbi:alpha/beta hydrolase-fold protein [Pseudoalteromonas sp. P94(2023)]|uniref:Alpha/beta hydrolase-fold protein n=2 Tax=Pseudoalteromonas obscura TaxID=3048491 RepID=A0ABT7EPX8_9GAMM|nr:alpha/beta hydrolase-fold protein [Pseudoalteromonas sp. P94(2023)]